MLLASLSVDNSLCCGPIVGLCLCYLKQIQCCIVLVLTDGNSWKALHDYWCQYKESSQIGKKHMFGATILFIDFLFGAHILSNGENLTRE